MLLCSVVGFALEADGLSQSTSMSPAPPCSRCWCCPLFSGTFARYNQKQSCCVGQHVIMPPCTSVCITISAHIFNSCTRVSTAMNTYIDGDVCESLYVCMCVVW